MKNPNQSAYLDHGLELVPLWSGADVVKLKKRWELALASHAAGLIDDAELARAKKETHLAQGGEKLPGQKTTCRKWATPEDRKIFTGRFLKSYSNLAWVIGDKHLVIDVDAGEGKDGLEQWEDLCEKFPKLAELCHTVRTPSGGFHIYFKLPEEWYGVKFAKNPPGCNHIDVKAGNSIVVIPFSARLVRNPAGTVTIEDERYEVQRYEWDNFAGEIEFNEPPAGFLEFLKRGNAKSGAAPKMLSDGNEDFTAYQEIEIEDDGGFDGNPKTPGEALKILQNLNCDGTYDFWFTCLAGINQWNHGRAGKKVALAWSKGLDFSKQKSKKFDKAEFDTLWDSLTERKLAWLATDKSAPMITFKTLRKYSRVAGVEIGEKKVKDLIEQMKGAESTVKIAVDIRDAIKREMPNLLSHQRNLLVSAYRHELSRLTGDKQIGVNEARRELGFIAAKRLEGDNDWYKGWFFVNATGEFFHGENHEKLSERAFNIRFGVKVPKSENGAGPSASKFVADNSLIPVVASFCYRPDCGILLDDALINGMAVNLFKPDSVPQPANVYLPKTYPIIRKIEQHFELLIGGRGPAEILIQYLAHNVQFPGKKILWCPAIVSNQGFGKSWIVQLMICALGASNVVVIKSDQIGKQFNPWAMGHCFAVIEELKIVGHSAHEAMNTMKPMVTDKIITIRDLYSKPFLTWNTQNYLILSNYKHCIPASELGRRYWLLYCQYETLSELARAAGEKEVNSYFQPLWDGVRNHGPELARWLHNYKITDDFLNLHQAPDSQSKQIAVETAESDIEGLQEIRDLIERGGPYYNTKVVSSEDLFADFTETQFNLSQYVNNFQKNLLLKKLGFDQICRLKIGGKVKRIWAKKALTEDEVRTEIQFMGF